MTNKNQQELFSAIEQNNIFKLNLLLAQEIDLECLQNLHTPLIEACVLGHIE